MGCLIALASLVLALFVGVPVAMGPGGEQRPAEAASSPTTSEMIVARAPDGRWEVAVNADDRFICSVMRTRSGEASGCASSLPADAIALATGSVRPSVAYGIVREDVDLVRLDLGTGEVVDAEVVSLAPVSLAARAFATPVPRSEDIVWFVGLDADGRELGRALGPAGALPTAAPLPTP